MKVFGWAADQAGCGFYRVGLPLDRLKRLGHDTQVSTLLTGFEKTADVVIGQRLCNPGPTRWWAEMAARPSGKRPALVYEVDDDLLDIDPTNERPYRYYGTPERRANIVANLAAADLVTVSTEPLADSLREYAREVRVIPNAVPDDLGRRSWQARSKDRLTIGWAGSGTHGRDFQDAGPQIHRFLRRHSDTVEWHSIGSDYLPATSSDTFRRRFTEWEQSVEAYYSRVDFHIGLAPLMPSVFNRSKSHIKALEYAAMGIPVIASDFGPYQEYVVHAETGFLVKQPHEWGTRLLDLVRDDRLRTIMGEKARRHSRAHVISAVAPLWESVLKEAIDAK